LSRAPARWTRRAFLGGAGVSLALPWLPSLRRGEARADGAPPVRLVHWYCPNGMNMADWTPASAGPGWELTPILAPLAGVRDEVCVLSGLANRPAIDFATGDHPRGTASFLSCAHILQGALRAGVSVDQIAATAVGTTTPFPSLQLKLQDFPGVCDPGYPCVYNETISWASPTTPLPSLAAPQVIFDRLFAGPSPAQSEAERQRRVALRTSILDHAIGQAAALQPALGVEDRARLDAYLTAVRELEIRVQAPPLASCPAGVRPGATLDVEATMEALTDLMALALRCDLTRFITFMQGHGGSPREMSHIGLPVQHHWASHHMRDPVKLAQLTQIGAWEIGWYARFLDKLRAIPEADGTLLDHALVVLGSEISDGNDHTHDDMPILLAGRGGGAVTPGRHLVYAGDPLADLHIATLAVVGVDVAAFGADGTRPLPGVLA
jgi:hypothetical protein